MATSEQKLQNIFVNHVELRSAKLVKRNTEIAKKFVKGFVTWLKSVGKGIQCPKVVPQGSSFEGVKVGAPDEFDFLLEFDYLNRSHLILAIESRNIEGPDIPGFWEVRVPHIEKPPLKGKLLQSRRWVKKYTETDVVERHLAPDLFRRELQTELNAYVDEKRENLPMGVKNVQYPSIGNPALTVVLTTNDDKEISIDMSIAIQLTIEGVQKTLFAKKHESDTNAKFWRNTVNAEELEKMRELDHNLKENYRIAKYLLKNVVKNSFVLKTAFFHMEQEIKHEYLSTKTGFLMEMIDYLASCYAEHLLPAFFNVEYNVLGNYPKTENDKKAGELRRLANRLKQDPLGTVEDLETRAEEEQ